MEEGEKSLEPTGQEVCAIAYVFLKSDNQMQPTPVTTEKGLEQLSVNIDTELLNKLSIVWIFGRKNWGLYQIDSAYIE